MHVVGKYKPFEQSLLYQQQGCWRIPIWFTIARSTLQLTKLDAILFLYHHIVFDGLPTGHRDWREAVRAFEVLYSVLTYEEKKKAEEKGKEDEV
jgi:hypothetical protein